MKSPFLRLFRVLAGSRQSDLRQQVQFLKAENEILRSRIKGPIRTTAQERARLVRLGKPLGVAIRDLISIVSPRTFARWVNRRPKREPPRRHRPGRPRTAAQVRRLVLRMARETDLGYTRLLGELRKLGVKVSRTSVLNILREQGVPTGPQRGEGTWAQFLNRHARTLWACDFAVKRVLTARGWKDAFLLVFIHPKSRRVHVSQSTTTPDAAWVAEQAAVFCRGVGEPKPCIVLRDRDAKFGAAFDDALRASCQ